MNTKLWGWIGKFSNATVPQIVVLVAIVVLAALQFGLSDVLGNWAATLLLGMVAALQVGAVVTVGQSVEDAQALQRKILEEVSRISPGSSTFHDTTDKTFEALLRARESATHIKTTKLSGTAPRDVRDDGTWGDWKTSCAEMIEWYDGVGEWLKAGSGRTFTRIVNVGTPEMRAWSDAMVKHVGTPGFEHVPIAGDGRPGLVLTIFDGERAIMTFSSSPALGNRYARLCSIEMTDKSVVRALDSGYYEQLLAYATQHPPTA